VTLAILSPRLPHAYPQWETPEDDSGGEPVEIWVGKMRIVHRQRARTLRRRGVPLLDLRPHTSRGYNAAGRAKYAWFVEVRT
jgi:hypothetical protein